MSSKQLESILSRVPAATATYAAMRKSQDPQLTAASLPKEQTERIVAVVPKKIKDEIRLYLTNNPTETERIIILKGLKLLGFEVEDSLLVDKRSTR